MANYLVTHGDNAKYFSKPKIIWHTDVLCF